MRKVSKSRVDDDVTSTNESDQEERADKHAADNVDSDENAKDADWGSETNYESDGGKSDEEYNNKKSTPKKKKSLKKSDKKTKNNKKIEEEYEEERADEHAADNVDSDENAKDAGWGSETNYESDGGKSDEEYNNKKSTPKKKKLLKKSDKKTKNNKKIEEEYEVEKVIDSKKTKGKLFYLIRWKGYSADSDSWEPANTLSCPDLINKFLEEKENSKDKNGKTPTKGNKRKSKKASKPSKPSKRPKTEWDSENADENAEYEVERILEVHHKKNGKRDFLIHWKGWSSKFDSWEPEDNLNCSDLIERFMSKVSVARTSGTRDLRMNPEATSRFTLQDPTGGRRLSKRRGQRQRVRYDNAE